MTAPRSITVAIPAYNSGRFISEALESVFAQTLSVDECIVVDDGSSDESGDIAQSFDSVRYIWKENGGDASARNRAIQEASGDFIAFLDADDVWRADKLEKQMKLFSADPSLGMVYAGVEVVDVGMRRIDVLRPAPGHTALRNTLIVEKPYITGVGSTALVPIDIARKTTFDERLSASSDWAFACNIALNHPVAAVDEPLAFYRQHDDAQVHRNLAAVERDMHLIWNELFEDEFLPGALHRYRRRAAANLDISLAYSFYSRKEKMRAWRYLSRAFIRRPDRVLAAFWRRYRRGSAESV